MSTNAGYGWPMTLQPVLPVPGEMVYAQAGLTVYVEWVYGREVGLVGPGGIDAGTLRYGGTRDGLYWRRDGYETDHWAMTIDTDETRPGFRHWRLSRE